MKKETFPFAHAEGSLTVKHTGCRIYGKKRQQFLISDNTGETLNLEPNNIFVLI